jgi:hypothetical protein
VDAWKDELYHNMRGPAKNLTILSSAYSDPKQRGTGEHEPITYEVKYGKGRVIITTMGHFWNGQTDWDGLHCVGFQTIFARSVEYVATGKVTLPIPKEFPGPEEVSFKEPFAVSWKNAKAVTTVQSSAQKKKEKNPYAILTPEEELETFELAPGLCRGTRGSRTTGSGTRTHCVGRKWSHVCSRDAKLYAG